MPKWLSKFERALRPLAIPNLTMILVAGQIGFYLLNIAREGLINRMVLDSALVWQGQWWRLLTFIFVPPGTNPLFAFFAWYLFVLMGTALEAHWGALRYNEFLWIAVLATIAVAFSAPGHQMSNGYIGGTVFLAFAYMYPDFQLMLFFLIPVKIKYLALLTWIGYFYAFATAPDWPTRLEVVASVLNFFIFFGREVWRQIKSGKRRMDYQRRRMTQQPPAFRHKCTVCGITDKTNPAMDFRYCSKCHGTHGYCSEHLHSHQHIAAPQESSAVQDEK